MWEREKMRVSKGSGTRSVTVPVALLMRVAALPENTQKALRASLRAIYEITFDDMIKKDATKRMRIQEMYKED